ncbi:hypothetical protein CDAR_614981, partial [Caerostris darwini]
MKFNAYRWPTFILIVAYITVARASPFFIDE